MDQQLTIRPMQPEDKPALKRIAGRAFPSFQQLFISWTKHSFVAEAGGQPIGAIILKLYPLAAGAKGGCVAWIFTDPDARGMGAGQHLVGHALEYFDALGCLEVTTCVDGFNASSSKLFSSRGFEILSMGEQIKRYGLRLLPTWLHIFHYLDIGFFLWARPAQRQSQPPQRWLGTLLMNILIACLALLRMGNLGIPTALFAVLSTTVILGTRHLSMKAATKAQRLHTEYRPWETGFVLSSFIALFPGGAFLVPGSLYPVDPNWSQKDMKEKFARIAMAGVIPILALATAATLALHLMPATHTLISFTKYLQNALVSFSLFDILLAFFPFQVFNGRRILEWNKWAWIPFAAWTIALMLV